MTDIRADQFITQPEAIDSFSRLRVCSPTTLFDSHLQYNLQPIVIEEKTTTGGAVIHEPDGSSALLTVAAVSGASVILQTKEYHHHQLAKTQLIRLAGTLFSSSAGIISRFGYFDDENGIFVENDAGQINLVLRTNQSGSVVEVSVSRSEFNIDPLSGKSGLVLDPNKSQLIEIDMSSMGSVRVGFWIKGSLHFVHTFEITNLFEGSPLTTISLPIRYELINTTGANLGQLRMIYGSVISEGGLSVDSSYPMSVSNGITLKSITTRVPVLSIRPRTLFNGITNRGLVVPSKWAVFSQDKPILVEVIWGGTLTGANFSDVDTVHSLIESDTAATAITGGLTILSSYISPNTGVGMTTSGASEGEIKSRYPIGLDIDGNHPVVSGNIPFTDNLSLVVTSLLATQPATFVSGSLGWGEIY